MTTNTGTTFPNATGATQSHSFNSEVSRVHQYSRTRNQEGFSLIEMVIVVAVLGIVTAGIASVMKSSMSIAMATYELTDAQESLRTAQEYINRDLMNAGDGLKSMTYIPVNTTFVQNFLSRTPIADSAMPSLATNLGILTTDNNVPSGTTTPAPRPSPAASPGPTPITLLAGTDRQTILEIDSDLASNPPIFPSAINTAGDTVTLPSTTTTAQMNTFTPGEIYFLTSSRGGTFATITAVNASSKTLSFANGTTDFCGLNSPGANNRIKDISASGSIPTTLQRMRIIQYFVDSNKLLRRRVFGERGTPFRDNVIAEHVLAVQFIYSLGLDSNGLPVQPTDLLTTPVQQVNISQVQVTVTVETPHGLDKNLQPLLSSTSSTSLRNMQFRQALQPAPSPTP
jgi:prepilin-type N-terminal cleavage/methylation domain-containing protein